MKTVEAYQTHDGKLFLTEEEAKYHELKLQEAVDAKNRDHARRIAFNKKYQEDVASIKSLRSDFNALSRDLVHLKKIKRFQDRFFSKYRSTYDYERLKNTLEEIENHKRKVAGIIREIKRLKDKYRYDHHLFNK